MNEARRMCGGYVVVKAIGHPRAQNGKVYEHVLIAEKAASRYLLPPIKVHHVDEIKTHNAHSNLVVCENQAYHWLLHRRAKALRACGHADWGKCAYCKQWDSPENLYIRERPIGVVIVHRVCKNLRDKQNREKVKWHRMAT